MAKRFEDLDAWQVARETANLIYTYGRETGIATDYGFKDQIQRASVSVMNNIAEEQFSTAFDLCERESKLCWGLIKHLQKTSDWKTGLKITLMILIPSLAALQRF